MPEDLPSKVTCAEHALKIEHLEDWQNKQNGALNRLCEEMKTLKSWIMSLFGGMILSLILLILNLLSTR